MSNKIDGEQADINKKGAEKFFGTYKRSVNVMAYLPLATHRYLIEPVSGQQHMSTTLMINFLNLAKSDSLGSQS